MPQQVILRSLLIVLEIFFTKKSSIYGQFRERCDIYEHLMKRGNSYGHFQRPRNTFLVSFSSGSPYSSFNSTGKQIAQSILFAYNFSSQFSLERKVITHNTPFRIISVVSHLPHSNMVRFRLR